MPASPPYDTIEMVLNAARIRLNDAIQSLGGDVLKDIQPFTLPLTNLAWRVFQDVLAGLGVERLFDQTVLLNVPPVANLDPNLNVTVNWAGANDGLHPFIAPVLPQNMILPKELWERQTGTIASFLEMDKLTTGLPSVPKVQWNLAWEWRNDTLVLPGAVVPMDIRIRFLAYLPDFTSLTVTTQPVPILHCLDAFSNFIAAEVAKARGDVDGQSFDSAGRAAAALIAGQHAPLPMPATPAPAPMLGQ